MAQQNAAKEGDHFDEWKKKLHVAGKPIALYTKTSRGVEAPLSDYEKIINPLPFRVKT